jgi:hypothetical protein
VTNPVLLLFSSNIRPLYEQDILDVLGAPKGTQYKFRYASEYLNVEAERAWQTPELTGTRTLVVFSIQQAAKYHDPAFIPVREGVVIDSNRNGNLRFVTFELRDYASLGVLPMVKPARPDLGAEVRRFTEILSEHKAGEKKNCPYDCSAALVEDPLPKASPALHLSKGSGIGPFGDAATYLAQTQSFRNARFVTCQGVSRPSDTPMVPGGGIYEVDAGASYELVIMHSQPSSIEDVSPFVVSTDGDLVRVIGRAGFDVASTYDIVRVPIHVGDATELRETVVAVQPASNVQGPSISLRLRIKPRSRMGAAAVTASFIGLTGAAGLIPASNADVNTDFFWFKLCVVGLATTIAFFSVLSGFKLGSPANSS